MSDGGLRQLFAEHFKSAMWVPVETWSTGQGVPDTHYVFPGGYTGWIENKFTSGWKVGMRPEQVAWLERYSRQGGRCFIAVRRKHAGGPRRGSAEDWLWLYPGSAARPLLLHGLAATQELALGGWEGGPRVWGWPIIQTHLCAHRSTPRVNRSVT